MFCTAAQDHLVSLSLTEAGIHWFLAPNSYLCTMAFPTCHSGAQLNSTSFFREFGIDLSTRINFPIALAEDFPTSKEP